MSSRFVPRSSFHNPDAFIDQNMFMSEAAPSTMAVSTTWPRPDCLTSSRAHTSPKARYIPPPPKSPTRLSGGTGA